MSTRDLFARLIRCEAEGEGTGGMRAVATSVMNRVHIAYGEYQRINQGDLRSVIEQACQYSCYKSVIGGQQNPQNVWAKSPRPEDYEVADYALSGAVFPGITQETLWYMNPFNPVCPNFFPYNGNGYWYTRIGDHCFFNPTAQYAQT
jgi:N-acetylmuramoyl-L-alanine amidase